MSRCLRIAPTDNVAVALEPVAAGIRVAVEGASVTTREDIPQGHKLALTAIPAGADVIKYGYPIGRARTEIQPGQWVHTHNLATRLDGAGAPQAQVRGGAPAPLRPRSFQGYRRADGRVGIRNELWIVPTVGCVNGVARSMARRVEDYARGRVDGVHVGFPPYGCAPLGGGGRSTGLVPPLGLLSVGGGSGAHQGHPLRPDPPPQCRGCTGAGAGV